MLLATELISAPEVVCLWRWMQINMHLFLSTTSFLHQSSDTEVKLKTPKRKTSLTKNTNDHIWKVTKWKKSKKLLNKLCFFAPVPLFWFFFMILTLHIVVQVDFPVQIATVAASFLESQLMIVFMTNLPIIVTIHQLIMELPEKILKNAQLYCIQLVYPQRQAEEVTP